MRIRNQNKASAVAVGTALMILLGEAASAQQAQLNHIAARLGDHGYSVEETRTGWLYEGDSTSLRLWLQAGNDYSIPATCDRHCPDVDLELRDPNGNIVDSDFLTDDIPILEASPRSAGWYRVRVIMASCSAEPCRYALAVFRR